MAEEAKRAKRLAEEYEAKRIALEDEESMKAQHAYAELLKK
tara:strand:- start:197 stop:319 length:123 start_codon:yes stop_codon:yes gene_type:complete